MRRLIENIGALSTPVRKGDRAFEWVSRHGDLAMTVTDREIEFIGPRDQISGHFDSVVDAGKRLVTPGLIDAHTHPIFGGNRAGEFELRCQGSSYEEIAAAGGGIRSTVRATRELGQSEMLDQLRKHAQWFLSCGTTTIEAKTGYGLDQPSELSALAAMASYRDEGPLNLHSTLLALHALPMEFEGLREEYVLFVLNELLPSATRSGYIEWTDIFVENGYFSSEDAARLAKTAKSLGIGLRGHFDQLADHGCAKLAAELGFDTADHLEHANFEGLKALASSNTIPILLPGSVYALGKTTYPDARSMIDLGLPVVLATDFNPGSSPTPNLPFVMNLACLNMKMSSNECWLAVTAHAAMSLKIDHCCGILEPSYRADFVIWNANDDREIPYWIGAPLVHKAFVGGKCVFGDTSSVA